MDTCLGGALGDRFFAYDLHITPEPTAGRRDDQRTLTKSGPAKIKPGFDLMSDALPFDRSRASVFGYARKNGPAPFTR